MNHLLKSCAVSAAALAVAMLTGCTSPKGEPQTFEIGNKEFLLKEIDCYIEHLSEYKTAMEHDDEETLIRLLDEGKKRKEEVDG